MTVQRAGVALVEIAETVMQHNGSCRREQQKDSKHMTVQRAGVALVEIAEQPCNTRRIVPREHQKDSKHISVRVHMSTEPVFDRRWSSIRLQRVVTEFQWFHNRADPHDGCVAEA